MKIYQVHEYSGSYEDFFDYIIGSFIHRENAEDLVMTKEAEQFGNRRRAKRCYKCISHNYKPKKSCYKPDKSDYGEDCDNYYQCYDDYRYDIKEVEILDEETV